MNRKSETSVLYRALQAHRKVFLSVGAFSAVINLLMLVPTIYMLQVYDRVLVSMNISTLLMLTIITMGLFMLMAALEWVRSMALVRLSNQLDQEFSPHVFAASFVEQLRNSRGNPQQPLSDLNNIRQFVTGQGVFAFFDAPWAPLYILVVFLFHWQMGVMVVVGVLILLGLALANESATHKRLAEANNLAMQAGSQAHGSLRNAEVIEAMGMLAGVRKRWTVLNRKVLRLQTEASEKAGIITATTKFVRISLQSLILGLAALLVIENEITPGMIIAGSVLMGRALAPIEQLIATWKAWISAQGAYRRLEELLERNPEHPPRTSLPRPRGLLQVDGLVATPPGAAAAVLRGIQFTLPAGTVLGVIGPSGSGKSTLARLLVGVWPAQMGKVRIDGADIHDWDKSELGPHIGYLPQDIELFDGTIAENISRFGEVDNAKLLKAAELAGVHDMILLLPNGYDTPIGTGGQMLSGGQRQRVALARAVYGDPALLVLDEPNSNLDDVGERALLQAILSLKQQSATVVLITHRPSILGAADALLLLKEGTVAAFGPRDQVLAALQPKPPAQPTSVAGTNPIVAG
ncbi:type I secretion system permease/ATPase [Thiothrix unzii]|uniref:Type I secretion system permease/ATPase n=2 Tax=Thiothrix unzii TaxID=111769 RepID=A0A975IIU0_9GAMM|nr:type I secretion system permease/ATPase [Thiothrix unzii]